MRTSWLGEMKGWDVDVIEVIDNEKDREVEEMSKLSREFGFRSENHSSYFCFECVICLGEIINCDFSFSDFVSLLSPSHSLSLSLENLHFTRLTFTLNPSHAVKKIEVWSTAYVKRRGEEKRMERVEMMCG